MLPALGMTQGAFAEHLGVSRLTVSELLLEKRALSAEMAVRLSRVVGGSPESWLRMQKALSFWKWRGSFARAPNSRRSGWSWFLREGDFQASAHRAFQSFNTQKRSAIKKQGITVVVLP